MNAPSPFRGAVEALPDEEFAELARAVDARRCRGEVGAGTFAEAAALWRPEPPCPACGSAGRRNGRRADGVQLWRCPACGRGYAALAGTVLEGAKLDFPVVVGFVRLMCHDVQLDAAAEVLGISHQTAFEWRHRVLATVSGAQDATVLRDRVWIDEAYAEDSALRNNPDWRPMRGLSRNQTCIAVAIDVHKNVVVRLCGHGRPTSKRIREALEGHIAEGSTIVHDREKSHRALVRAVKGTDEPYKADTRDPAYLEGMKMVNSLCAWVKRFIWRYVGMKPANLQSCLDWYAYLFRVKRQDEKWPKVERVVRHLAMSDASYRSSRQRLLPPSG